jgi:hypothetical protein
MITKRISGVLHPQTMPQLRLRIFQPAPQGSQLRAEVKHTVCGGHSQPAWLMQNLLNGYSFDVIVMRFLLILVGIPAAHFATCSLAFISPAISDPSSPPLLLPPPPLDLPPFDAIAIMTQLLLPSNLVTVPPAVMASKSFFSTCSYRPYSTTSGTDRHHRPFSSG